jgi:hypothetical protein
MVANLVAFFPILVPGLLLYWTYNPTCKRRPTLRDMMIAVALIAPGLGVLTRDGTPWWPVNLALVYTLYLVPFAWVALFVNSPADERLAILWFTSCLFLCALL